MTTPVVADLARLIAFPTVSDRPVTELAAFVARRLEGLGFAITHFHTSEAEGKCNLMARIGPRGTDGLVLSGHMDVVPVDGQPWTSDPFVLREHQDRLFGRGTSDMKGFLAAVMRALERIPAAAYQKELVLLWTHDEEVGCTGSGHLVHQLGDEPLPRACLIGEPTDFRILRQHAGHVHVHVAVEGEAAHSSRPALGRNAIDAACAVVAAARATEREFPGIPLNVATITGGSAVNIVPDHCSLQIGYRPQPGMAATALYDRFRERLAHLATPCTVRPTLGTVTPAMLTEPDTPLARSLEAWAEPGDDAAPFATDGGNLARLGMAPKAFQAEQKGPGHDGKPTH